MPTRPDEIWQYYESAQVSFALTFASLERAEVAQLIPPKSVFFGCTPSQVSDLMRKMADEFHLEVSLALVASIEAILKEDFILRTGQAGKGVLHARLAALRDRLGDRADLEDLLDAWKEAHPSAGKAVGEFKQVIHFRHWLAHGRRGHQKGFAGFDPKMVYTRAKAVQDAIPSIPQLVDW